MTFPTQIPSITYNGDNVTTSWVYNFEIPYQSDGITPAVRVYLTSPTGINTVLVLGTDYVINNVGNLTGGTIVTAATVAPGWTITIQRALHVDQLTAFPNQGFLASDIEAALDKLTMLVQDASLAITSPVSGPTSGVTTFNGRAGTVTLTGGDITSAGGALSSSLGSYAPLNSPGLTGSPTAPTPTAGTNNTQLATTQFVASAIASIPTGGVSSFNTRTGAVTFQASDVTGVGGALLASPIFTGTPQGPTALAGTNNTQLATTQFVTAAIAAIPGGSGTVTNVSSATADLSVATPTSTPVLTVNSAPKWSAARALSFTGDVTGSGNVDGSAAVATGMTLATVNANVGTFGDATHVPQVTVNAKGLVTAASAVAITGGGTVSSVGLSMPVDFTVTNSPVTGSGTLTAAWNSQAANLVMASPSGASGVPTFRALTTTDIPSLSGSYVPLTGGTMTGQLTVGGNVGIRLNKSAGQNNNFYGDTAGSHRWQVVLGNTTAEGGSNVGSDFNINAYSDTAVLLGTALSITRSNSLTTLSSGLEITGVQGTGAPSVGYAIGIDAGAGHGAFIKMNSGGSGQGMGFQSQTAGSVRWIMNLGDGTAESGSNAGSNFVIQAYSDTGTLLSGPLTINRATGNATFAAGIDIVGAPASGPSSGWTLAIDAPSGVSAGIKLNGLATYNRYIESQTGGVSRWRMFLADGSTESGSNAGSNLTIQCFSDSGAYIGAPFSINRASQIVTTASSIVCGYGIVYNSLAPNNIGFKWSTGLAMYIDGVNNGTIATTSDERTKKDIKAVETDALSDINAISLKSFDQIFEPGDTTVHFPIGFIAQQLQKIGADLVHEDPYKHDPKTGEASEETRMSVALLPLLARCVGAIQKLTARVEELEANARAQP